MVLPIALFTQVCEVFGEKLYIDSTAAILIFVGTEQVQPMRTAAKYRRLASRDVAPTSYRLKRGILPVGGNSSSSPCSIIHET